jgi:PEP-CTERM motif
MKAKMIFKKTVLAVLATVAMGSGAANAATGSLTGLVSDPLTSNGFFTATFQSWVADSAATLDFVINGYNSLDGHNPYEDRFTLTINGAQSFSGSFNLGGGGWSDTTLGTGTAVTLNDQGLDPVKSASMNGGTTTVSGLEFNLLQGVNTFLFAYDTVGPDQHPNQLTQYESWNIGSATVSSVSAVPEPETYAMMLAGLGLMGTIARRRKQKLQNA